ncbi:polyprenyl synthetase family protein [Frankia sp. CgS1]|uniref:polyprenyl synthetase family protein n=1 Tax=unclassified Frankia TaxID=2632575 RepID=UPI0032C221DE
MDDDLIPFVRIATEFLLAEGKRLRPAFCYWGWRGAGGPDCDEIVTAAAAIELLHACALIHDDVMDASDTRRGRPAAHRRFSRVHRTAGWRGDPADFGRSAAILLGDLFLAWADELLAASRMPPEALVRAWPTYGRMRSELMAGQYLDLVGQAEAGPHGGLDPGRAVRIARYKTAGYTVVRPLQLGGLLAGAPPDLLAAYAAFGLPLGEAFQLRDDLLGVFGDPAVTGKPTGEDLRDGRPTGLLALALTRAQPAAAARLRTLISPPVRRAGHPEDAGQPENPGYSGGPGCSPGFGPTENPAARAARVAEARDIIAASGAVAAAEERIAARTATAVEAARRADLDVTTLAALTELAMAATSRSH